MAREPTLAVVLINYNNEVDTINCLETLSKQTLEDFLTIVVDNGSDTGSIHQVKEEFSFPKYIQNDENCGFTGGNNRGIEYALDTGVDWVLLLNNDTEVEPEFLESLLTAAEDLPQTVGITGPKIHTYDSREVWAAGGSLNEWTGETAHRVGERKKIDQRTQVDYIVGAALLARSEVFRDIGLLDDDFFIYYEETEFCQRARQAGWHIWYLPVSGVYHKETVDYTFSSFREYYFTRNRLLLIQKTQPFHRRLVFYLYFLLRCILLQSLYLVVVRRDFEAVSATLRGGHHAIRGRTGRLDT